MSDKDLIEEARTIAKHSAVSLPEHADCLRRLADALEAATGLRAERDAALAAIERVAALHVESDWKCGNPRHTNPEIGCPECPRIELHIDRFVAHRADHADPAWVAAREEWLELARSNVAALNERRRKNDER